MSNKKKQILNESTVRRFMGLAGIGALSNNFVNEKQIKETDGLEEQESGDMPYKGSENKGGYGKMHSLGKIDSDIPKAPTGLGKKPVASTPDLPKNLEEQEEFPPEEELPPMDDLGAEGEMPPPEEAPVEDVDISQEEAEVLISLGRKQKWALKKNWAVKKNWACPLKRWVPHPEKSCLLKLLWQNHLFAHSLVALPIASKKNM